MPEHFTLYSAAYESLPEENMRQLADAAEFSVSDTEDGGRRFTYTWPNVRMTCTEMPAHQVPNQLQGFAGWIMHIYQGKPDARGKAILDRIHASRLIVGVVIEPLRDEEGRAEQVLAAMSNGLDALLFFDSAIYDKNCVLVLAPDGSFDEQAVIGNVPNNRVKQEVTVPREEAFEATPLQKARYDRVLALLKERNVPTLSYALHIEDEHSVTLRSPEDVARRALVLSAVTLVADGGSREQALQLIEQRNLWLAVSPEERSFLEATSADSDLAHKLLWRFECLWVLMWALGKQETLDWPARMCDVPALAALLAECEKDAHFIEAAYLRSKTDILDALQTTMLLHWAIRDAWIHRRSLPEDLDWSGKSRMVTIHQCPAVGVVAERHHTLNWLTCFAGADWDNVDTPT